MSEEMTLTHHAMLVIWGQFAQSLGLIEKLNRVPLRQKTVDHRPQTKVLEFLVAILAGCSYLKDISRSAHPIDQDPAVAKAWAQTGWADYSGVSRALTRMSLDEAHQIERALLEVSQPIIDREAMLALEQWGELVYDGDLTGRQVSNTSRTYPNVAFGHMGDDQVGLGYQAGMVSLESPTYGRIWLSSVQHPGNTLSCTQAEALVLAAEARTGLYPRRRVELLRARLESIEQERLLRAEKCRLAQQAVSEAQAALHQVEQDVQAYQQKLAQQEAEYRERGLVERPHSHLSQTRSKVEVYQARSERRQRHLAQVQRKCQQQEGLLAACQQEQQLLQQRLQKFHGQNAAQTLPIRAVFRLDGGFGSFENLALLIEMGYEVYTKTFGDRTTRRLKRWITETSPWTSVGVNAKMLAWKDQPLKNFPYRVDLALECFYAEKEPLYNSLIHFGQDPVTSHVKDWFHRYNHRQVIEAGIKEGKSTFEIRHLKVRSEAGLFLQETFTIFAANFVRWANHWLVEQCPNVPNGWRDTAQPCVKEQVKVAAQTSAWVTSFEQGYLLRFTDFSVFAGKSLHVKKGWAYQLALPFAKSCLFS